MNYPPPMAADDPQDPSNPRRFTPKHYAVDGGLYWGSPETATKLDAAFYMPSAMPGIGPCLRKLETRTDDLLRLPDPTCDMLLKEFVDFWSKADQMARRGLATKRGLFLHGPPGSGKTSALQLMCHHMIREMGGVVVLVNHPQTTAAALQLVRQVEADRPIILVYEDIDAMVEHYGEPGLLALLDGELQVANVVNVATSNYPERLDPRFTDRPGRFDRITLVGMPLPEARAAYFAAKAPEIDEAERTRWVHASEGWSLAHLRELIVAHLVLEEPADVVIERLNGMRERLPKSGDHRAGKVGFLNEARAQQRGNRLASAGIGSRSWE